ncbi:hypothetical protein mRhiFer1_009475 [Rhinolophus ferrumequinum]|uniref:Uncharacterized protein n=1 Tax=Rhinolophus ferrumequinum TaxID=59479 RepID=A0A7J7REU8_RHIFE|nr:hypothetical protein mRhiFer1_009475 [Rhinolophus ferrumequinum]
MPAAARFQGQRSERPAAASEAESRAPPPHPRRPRPLTQPRPRARGLMGVVVPRESRGHSRANLALRCSASRTWTPRRPMKQDHAGPKTREVGGRRSVPSPPDCPGNTARPPVSSSLNSHRRGVQVRPVPMYIIRIFDFKSEALSLSQSLSCGLIHGRKLVSHLPLVDVASAPRSFCTSRMWRPSCALPHSHS